MSAYLPPLFQAKTLPSLLYFTILTLGVMSLQPNRQYECRGCEQTREGSNEQWSGWKRSAVRGATADGGTRFEGDAGKRVTPWHHRIRRHARRTNHRIRPIRASNCEMTTDM